MDRLRVKLLAMIFCGNLIFTRAQRVPTPRLTIHSPDGDLIDCIDITEQPAFTHPLLKNHKIQRTPTHMPDPDATKIRHKYKNWQKWHKNDTKCPDDTIPLRRLPSSDPNAVPNRVTKGHEYAIGFMGNKSKIFGTQATINVWQPTIEGTGEFSLGQIWLKSGDYVTNDVNTIEAGWQVFPDFYNDKFPRFFIYWRADAYNQTTGCYNHRCGGFVQTSKTIVVEGTIDHTSTFEETQVQITIRMWKDQEKGLWWLGIVFEHGILEPVGYWSEFLFTGLRYHAENVQWGGEIVNRNPYGRHTRTEMGSGYLPHRGSLNSAAYMRNLEVALTENVFHELRELWVGGTHIDYYRTQKFPHNPQFGTHFFYGGPRQLAIAIGVHLAPDSSLLYLCLSLLLVLFV